MAIVYLTNASGAPGVSTLATALTLNWPKRAVLLEADVTTTGHVLTGPLQGQVGHSMGMTELNVAHQHAPLTGEDLWAQRVGLSEGKDAVPGFRTLANARGASEDFWAGILGAVDQLGTVVGEEVDVIVDGGRYQVHDPRSALIGRADAVLMLTGQTLPDVASARVAASALKSSLDNIGHSEWLSLVTVGAPRYWEKADVKDIAKVVGADVLGSLPWDPRGAAHYSHGSDIVGRRRTKYQRALEALTQSVTALIEQRAYTPIVQEQRA
ncbi:hypothetical protein E4U02_07585 [Microbacterium paludicola]|uniref:ParA family protein n=1 Tax=Microbacterium paludicola TaxID=300019 RepID=A0A4Y9FVQ6_9MICO|nr:hypothetical protein [Microbacterium paludicola]MBF0816268.1 hypothetical protein [Microbacterium paludicola]TFU33069.1 hypothetical protein E4U02_07585 [Microbacterium paludicola]